MFHMQIVDEDQGVLEPMVEFDDVEDALERAKTELLRGNAVDVHPDTHCQEHGCES